MSPGARGSEGWPARPEGFFDAQMFFVAEGRSRDRARLKADASPAHEVRASALWGGGDKRYLLPLGERVLCHIDKCSWGSLGIDLRALDGKLRAAPARVGRIGPR